MLEDLKPPARTYPCKVSLIAEGLSQADRKIFLEAVDNPEWKYKTLQNELAKRGIVLVDTTIARHRSKNCGCYRR